MRQKIIVWAIDFQAAGTDRLWNDALIRPGGAISSSIAQMEKQSVSLHPSVIILKLWPSLRFWEMALWVDESIMSQTLGLAALQRQHLNIMAAYSLWWICLHPQNLVPVCTKLRRALSLQSIILYQASHSLAECCHTENQAAGVLCPSDALNGQAAWHKVEFQSWHRDTVQIRKKKTKPLGII